MSGPGRPSFLVRYWPVLAGILGAIVMIALVSGRILYRPFNTPSAAMEATLEVDDVFLVSQFAYQSAPPARGDVIVFDSPHHAYFIKRVIGLPGDHVQMIGGILYVNKKPVPKKRVADFVETDAFGITTRVPQFRETLPGGRTYLVLDRGETEADNTRDFLVPAGSYFVMGDNRDNSDDSRLSLGFIARDAIIGRATTIYFSDGKPVWRDIR